MERLTIAVEFGGVSIGDTTARLGCKISRERMSLETADKLFAGRLLSGVVDLENGNAAPDQQRLPGMEDAATEIGGSFQVKQFSVNAKQIGLGLTFGIENVDVATLALFAKRHGRLTIADVSDLQATEHDHPDVKRGENNPHTRGTPALFAAAKMHAKRDIGGEMELTELIKFGMTAKKIELVESACGGSTIAKLEEWFRTDPLWNTRIKGMGEEWVTKFQNAHLAFRLKYPIPSDDEPDEEPELDAVEPSLEERFIGLNLPSEWLPKLAECGIRDAFDLVAAFANDDSLRFAGRFSAPNVDELAEAASRWADGEHCATGCRFAYADGEAARRDGLTADDNPHALMDPRFSHWEDGWNDAEPKEIFDAEPAEATD